MTSMTSSCSKFKVWLVHVQSSKFDLFMFKVQGLINMVSGQKLYIIGMCERE